MKLKSYLLILSLLLLSNCSVFNTPEKEVVTVTEIVRPQITVAEKPKSLKLTDVKWFIVNKDNVDQFLLDYECQNGDLVFYVISVTVTTSFSGVLNTEQLLSSNRLKISK
jgi:hypothetical protein